MPRTYTPRARAESAARTRERILETARRMLPDAEALSVDRIAAEAGVSVQTLYTQFGSKRGLLMAVIDTVQREAGLYADFQSVWSSRDGETALRRMLAATFRVWHGAWPFVAFSERARRTDQQIGTYLREVDGYRRSNLVSITERLEIEGRLRNGLSAATAADLAFALTVPAVYEELVQVRGLDPARAASLVIDGAVAAIVDPSTSPVTDPPADWSTALRPADVIESASAGT